MTYDEKIEMAVRGLELIRRSMPGSGPTTERIANRKRGKELTLPFLRHRRVPAKWQETSDKIMNEINDLI